MKKYIVGFLLSSLSLWSNAATVACSNVEIKSVYVEGARDDGFHFANNLIIQISPACAGFSFTHYSISDPAINQFLTVALAAKKDLKRVSIAVNTSAQTADSNQLAFIGIPD